MPKNTVFQELQKQTSVNYKLCYAEFPRFYALRQHKNTQHGTETGFGASNIDVEDIVGDVEYHCLGEDLRSFEHFLVDFVLEKTRHKVFNYAIENLNPEIIDEKLACFFNNLKCAAKVNLAFGFILRKLEDGGFRYCYAHENNTLLD